MELKSFQVHNFRNIVDSGEVEVDENVTCLVGKNEAGKSALPEALYLLNPAYEDDIFDANDQYPRWLPVQDRKREDLEEMLASDSQIPLKVNRPSSMKAALLSLPANYSIDAAAWKLMLIALILSELFSSMKEVQST